MCLRAGLAVIIFTLFGRPGLACEATYDADRIVVAGGSLTEILYEFGMAGRIVGADRTSNYPAAALELPQVGYVRNLSAEGLLALNPTLVLGEDDMGPVEVVAQVRAAGIGVARIDEVHTVQGILDKVDCVARVVGADASATNGLSTRLAGQANRLANVNRENPPRVAVLLNLLDGVPMAAGADTSAQGLLDMAGGRNVFEFEGWKPVSLEAMAKSDPEFVIMPIRGVESAGGAQTVLSHPSLRLTTAGRNEALIAIDGMAMLGFGPRTLDVAIDLAERFESLEPAAGD